MQTDRTDQPTADNTADNTADGAAVAERRSGFGLRSLWRRLKGPFRETRPLSARTALHLRQILDDSARGAGGEISARDRAAEVATTYATLSDPGKQAFFELLLDRYGPDNVNVEQAIAQYHSATDPRAARGAATRSPRSPTSFRARIAECFAIWPALWSRSRSRSPCCSRCS